MRIHNLDIDIKRSSRKTVSIFIERDGSVSARIPKDLNDEQLSEVIKVKEYQIHKNLAQWKQLNETKIEREYVNGQSFLYLGRNYRLKLENENYKGIKLKNGYFLLSKDNKQKAKKYFIEFYKVKLQEKILPLVEQYKNQLGVKPNYVKVMELQHRWASCSEKGNLNFHWKCAMAPIDTLKYIVIHELVHLIHPNHTTAFWNDVDKIVPDYERQVKWLELNGAGMDL